MCSYFSTFFDELSKKTSFFQIKLLSSDPFFNLCFGVYPQRGDLGAQQMVTLDGCEVSKREPHAPSWDPEVSPAH